MKLSLRTLFILIFIYISIPGYIFAEDKSSETIDLDFEIPEVEKKPYSFNAEFEDIRNDKRV